MEGTLQKGEYGDVGCLYMKRLLNGIVQVCVSWSLPSPSGDAHDDATEVLYDEVQFDTVVLDKINWFTTGTSSSALRHSHLSGLLWRGNSVSCRGNLSN